MRPVFNAGVQLHESEQGLVTSCWKVSVKYQVGFSGSTCRDVFATFLDAGKSRETDGLQVLPR